jgi:hypothetical protein
MLPVWENSHHIFHGIQTTKILREKAGQMINCEDDVNCGVIAFCDKRRFLTSNVFFLLQKTMGKELADIRNKMKIELDCQRAQQKEELLSLRVSSPRAVQICTILQPSIEPLISRP